jgi:1,4-alpha-glucan branching enzyme
MKTIATLSVLLCITCGARAVSEAQPASSNVMGAAYRIDSKNRVTFQLRAPDAQEVQVRLPQGRFDMSKGENGIWNVTTPPLIVGFHYYSLVVDGVARL